jgi:hypothetical protein
VEVQVLDVTLGTSGGGSVKVAWVSGGSGATDSGPVLWSAGSDRVFLLRHNPVKPGEPGPLLLVPFALAGKTLTVQWPLPGAECSATLKKP